jgi:hypothetical protein
LRPTNGITIDLGAVETTTDFDNDGVPDAWEQARGTDYQEPADAAADLDNDGLNGYDEYVIDTNPYDSAPFAITDLIQSSEITRITVLTSAERLYTVQATTNLAGGGWNAVSGQQNLTGVGGPMTFIGTNTQPERVFRVRVRVP